MYWPNVILFGAVPLVLGSETSHLLRQKGVLRTGEWLCSHLPTFIFKLSVTEGRQEIRTDGFRRSVSLLRVLCDNCFDSCSKLRNWKLILPFSFFFKRSYLNIWRMEYSKWEKGGLVGKEYQTRIEEDRRRIWTTTVGKNRLIQHKRGRLRRVWKGSDQSSQEKTRSDKEKNSLIILKTISHVLGDILYSGKCKE